MQRTRGTWSMRFLIYLLTAALGVLIFWILGFFMSDVESIPGPDFAEVEARYVDQTLVEQEQELNRQQAELERSISSAREEQQVIGESSTNLQETINQLISLQRISIENDAAMSTTEKDTIATSLEHFLASQQKFQDLNQRIAQLTSEKIRAEDARAEIQHTLQKQREPAVAEYGRLDRNHRIKLAGIQLAILVPVLLVAAYFLVTRRTSAYYPLFIALGGGTLTRVVLVLHEYFPARFFKYIVIIALLLVVARILLHLIRLINFPKPDVLLRQYREAYERFLCPVCNYPIRTGPRKWLYWTRRTVHKVLPQSAHAMTEEPYACPSCGTRLFHACESCSNVRHSLLPYCDHCGTAREPLSPNPQP